MRPLPSPAADRSYKSGPQLNLEQLQEILRIRRCSALLVIIKVDVGVELIALPAPDAPCPEAESLVGIIAFVPASGAMPPHVDM